ncbi:hypothetical protein A2U01_0011618, partial [Trifolium medium]|nr:hypothetical protein [Trifolium medium]
MDTESKNEAQDLPTTVAQNIPPAGAHGVPLPAVAQDVIHPAVDVPLHEVLMDGFVVAVVASVVLEVEPSVAESVIDFGWQSVETHQGRRD